MVYRMAVGAQLPDKIRQQREGLIEGREIGDLRANVHVDAGHAEAGQGGGFRVDGARAGNGNAELVLGLAG